MPGIKLFTTDNPLADEEFFLDMTSSFQAQQDEFDANIQKRANMTLLGGDSPFAYNISRLNIKVVQGSRDMVQAMNAIIDCITVAGIIRLDAEWCIKRNGMGH